jgi:cytochrome oxidase Cu insertion factor (SCO1/SenC/PrrC family)
MRRNVLTLPALLFLGLFVAGCGWLPWRKPAATPTGAQLAAVGQVAPEIDGDDMTGQRLRLADFRGQVVVVDFWLSC